MSDYEAPEKLGVGGLFCGNGEGVRTKTPSPKSKRDWALDELTPARN